ncbi:MAG: DNA-directed DNA polymerase II small subunit [Euryarchaeota archaeon]|nr:DNA-directed DNA polymerase II small subunit [Euryarchaeota archaeon]
MEDSEIVSRFVECGVNLHPEVLAEIKRSPNREELIDRLIDLARQASFSVITPDKLRSLEAGSQEEGELSSCSGGSPGAVVLPRRRRRLSEEYDSALRIKREKDITKKSYCQGSIESFVSYFNNRFERLAKLLKSRSALKESVAIELVKSTRYTGEVKLIGMVSDIRTSRKGNLILELEDPTGVIPVLIRSQDRELIEQAREVTRDEVIGVAGYMPSGFEMVLANELFFPDVPLRREPRKSEEPVAIALISDVHVGSTQFMENTFVRFLRWLSGEVGTPRQRELASRVKYLVIGGDLVDGVGIYPEQKDELVIKDIHQQYAHFSRLIERVPEHIEIVITPGNHDAARQAEPQPAIEEEFAPMLYEDPRVHMVGNPCYATVHGVELVSYHGRSLDDIIASVPGLSYSSPARAMRVLLRKRHLSPIYGGRVPLAPELFDYLLMEEPPDILHMGHVHTTQVENYRGTVVVNSGTFQEQTSFQRKMNIHPTPGRVPIIDLQNMRTTIMRFG